MHYVQGSSTSDTRKYVKLILEQHCFALCSSTNMWIFVNKNIRKKFGDLQQFEKTDEPHNQKCQKKLRKKLGTS